MSKQLRILLADDHTLVRQGFKRISSHPDWSVVAEASDGSEAMRLALEIQPDVAILDLAMPLMNGIDAPRRSSGGRRRSTCSC